MYFQTFFSEIPIQNTGGRILATEPPVAVIRPPATEATGGRIMATVETLLPRLGGVPLILIL